MKKRTLIFGAACIGLLVFLIILYFSITFEITLQAVGNGTLQAETLCVHPFGNVRIRTVPNADGEYTVLRSISVNGEDMTDAVRFDTLSLRWIWGNQTVCAVFEPAGETVRTGTAVFV